MALVDKVWDILRSDDGGGTKSRVKATVSRIEQDGTVWVHVEGGASETPVYSTSTTVQPGDEVEVTIAGGKAYIDGSTSSPSVGMVVFNKVVKPIGETATDAARAAGNALADSAIAKKVAGEAAQLVSAVGQHFWHRSTDPHSDGAGTGAFVTDETQEDFLSAAEQGFPALSDSKPYGNLLMNSLGIAIRSALKNLVTITRSATSFYDGTGNAAANVTASFGADGAQIGKSSSMHTVINGNGFRLINSSGQWLASLGETATIGNTGTVSGSHTRIEPTSLSINDYYGSPFFEVTKSRQTNPTITENFPGSEGPSYPLSYQINKEIHIDGGTWRYRIEYVKVDGVETEDYTVSTAESGRIHVITLSSTPSASSVVSVRYEAISVSVSYALTFTHRKYSSKWGSYSTSLGNYGESSGDYSFNSGYSCTASGNYSHAQNLGTIASGEAQTAIGKYNADNSANAFMIGDGTSDSDRHTGFAYRWNGELAMGAKDGGSNISLYQNHVTRGTTPSSDTWLGGLQWRDVNGRRLGILEYGVLANGKNRVSIGISTNNESGQTTNGYQSIFSMTKTNGSTSTRSLAYDCDTGELSTNDGSFISGSARLDLSKADNGLTSRIYPGFWVLDKGGRIAIRLECNPNTNGETGFYLYARQYDTNGDQVTQKGISLKLNKAGTGTWTVTDPANFRSAIGAQATLSTATTVTSGVVTPATNFKVTAQQFTSYGKIAMVKISLQTTAAVTAGTTKSVGTLASGKRPAIQAGAVAGFANIGVHDGYITDAGSIQLEITSNLASGANVYVWSTFILP